ncbi:hypothetical protein CUN59_16190 [Cuspidothrix issatschenkoi CHARLIE-1]|uniref:Uncharacterized protein n=1 Tax=Cuspidothrix issatschenkoi CHARLIE-1 TaxID=2052836 RepID=A0A2S6CRG4_9CYAN|nr:hypothetical protein CUN59_16190 [Cuspidothrix issatschenkoi CHARLIE-1]
MVHGSSVLLRKGTGNREQGTGNREQGTLRLAQGIAGNREQAINNSIQKYVFIVCKVVKYQIVTFYENPLTGQRYAKNTRRYLP